MVNGGQLWSVMVVGDGMLQLVGGRGGESISSGGDWWSIDSNWSMEAGAHQ